MDLSVVVLGLEYSRKTVEGVVDEAPQSPVVDPDVLLDQMTDSRQYACDEPFSQRTSVSDSDGPRQSGNGDFGTFTISYDAPSPRSRRDTCSLTDEEDAKPSVPKLPNGAELSDSKKRERLPKTAADSCNKRSGAGLKKLPRPLPVAPRAAGKALTGIAVARSVGDVARASLGSNTAVLPRSVKKCRQTPPPGSKSTWSCWRQDSDVSDSVSEAGVSREQQQRRSAAARSAPAVTTRSNRTFALRCAAKKRSEATTSPTSKPARSRSAENNARLALAARSGSGSRARNRKETENADWRQRRPSGDSSASLSSSVSAATHDGSYFRRDGGRYSMRMEKSNTAGSLSAAAKQFQVVGKSKQSGGQQQAKQPTGKVGVAQSKEMTAWKRRKEYDPRKSVANAIARRVDSSQNSQRAAAKPEHDAGLGTADEIAKLSNAVAYNLSVLSQSSQSDAVTLVSHWLLGDCRVLVFAVLTF